MSVNVRAQITAYISILRTTLVHMADGTNPTMVKEILSPFWLEDVDKFVMDTCRGGKVDSKIFNEEVSNAWTTYSGQHGGAIPDGSVSDATVVQRRIIYLEALEKSYIG